MKAREIMTVAVATVSPHTPVGVAAAMLTEREIASLPVLDENRVVGIVSEMDLIGDRLPGDARFDSRWATPGGVDPAREVREVMTAEVVCLGAAANIADLAELMATNDIRAVPIVEGARLVGITSRRDVLRTLLRDDVAVRADVLERINQYTGDHKGWTVEVDNGNVLIRGQFNKSARQAIIMQLARAVPGVLRVVTEDPTP